MFMPNFMKISKAVKTAEERTEDRQTDKQTNLFIYNIIIAVIKYMKEK